MPTPGAFDDMPISLLPDLSTRAYNALRRNGIHTIGHLAQQRDNNLLAIKDFGSKSLENVKAAYCEFIVHWQREQSGEGRPRIASMSGSAAAETHAATLASELGLSAQAISDVRDTPIEWLPATSHRISTQLRARGIETVGQLINSTRDRLHTIPYVGSSRHIERLAWEVTRLLPEESEPTLAERMCLSDEEILGCAGVSVDHLPDLPEQIREWLALEGIDSVGSLLRCHLSHVGSIYDLGPACLRRIEHSLRDLLAEDSSPMVLEQRRPKPLLASAKGQALAAWLAADPSLPTTTSLRQIGATLGLSRERVRQLLNRLGVPERKRREPPRSARRPIPLRQDDPGYAAYARALSRGAPESVAKARASTARWWYAKGRAKRRMRYYGDEELRTKLLKADRERRRARYREDADYRATVLDQHHKQQAKRYHEDPDYRARILARHGEWRARKREEREAGGKVVE